MIALLLLLLQLSPTPKVYGDVDGYDNVKSRVDAGAFVLCHDTFMIVLRILLLLPPLVRLLLLLLL